ncbi:tetratricopeptide repeat protein [Tenacibaculum mesophilum]|uniref:ATP-binding protein n=1 Tax=Tenacibaculum mesophilum TaxID=104268 RepID=UPI0014307B79|nr:tetratricopeptide repeat-containing sensor histidine kinase [Tenacibaculum mesophilum]KAF9658074.1 tetratricopeptide repeat protein [Tenacibaculum mesophilum]
MKTDYNKTLILIASLLALQVTEAQQILKQELTKKNDSINYWIKASKKNNIPRLKRIKYLNKAYLKTNKLHPTKYKSKNLSYIAYQYFELKDTISFKKANKEALKLSEKIKDTFSIADIHWSYGDFYKAFDKYDLSYSHYYLALENFKLLKKDYESARMLYSMAYIKGRYRDYIGSEVLIFEAIKAFKKRKKNKWLYLSYNHLGLLQEDIKEYDKALFYYNKSLEYFSKVKNKEKEYIASYNNIGNIYRKKGELKKAIEFYNKDLNTKVKPLHYAILLDNRAYTRLLLNDTINLKKDFYKALAIRDSLENKTAILASKIHISDYYKHIKDTVKALQYTKEAYSLAKELKNGGDYLTTLQQLANLDKQNSKKYLDRYIEFNDSLISAERRIQNKFTRIEFETDEYIEETERLSQQRVWIIVTSFAGLLVLSLLYFLRVQKVRNEKLKLEAEQQKANEEVYVLTLQQQAKLEEERVNERNRISAELHDGVLGKLFGTRVNLGFLAMQMKPETQEKHQAFLDELQEIEKEIRDVSHRLSDNFDSANINFTTILTQLLKDRSAIGNFTYQFDFDKTIPWNEINEVTKANVYRIIQEALQNIIKHAKAKNVTLDASFKREELIISLKDDGIGFNAEKKKKGIGIKNITARVQKLGGTLEFISKENQGTTLVIITPFNTKNGK